METDFDSSIPRDMAWGAVMRPVPFALQNEMIMKNLVPYIKSLNICSDFHPLHPFPGIRRGFFV
jgi:hypothetical protein